MYYNSYFTLYHYTKVNTIWIIVLNKKAKTLKPVEQNIKGNIYYLGVDKGYIGRIKYPHINVTH